jgi:hypothetical protein
MLISAAHAFDVDGATLRLTSSVLREPRGY